ncbi:TPA: helix-turn-helix transcriptional regulator [Pseudomonas aeruginosa]|uniref:helix-turn-helix domain-containing protein n=1 Tax=Pseudomonas aeruginosa TaxID=287 RepID=UPI0009A48F14|nr:helix-turn-helix transcriptional regulator [Pseudomonas aeruginosa]ELL0593644.1 helix-turn-helix transcriptional regulator [Pseudomonas aeruginosa]MBG4379512.1 helix-turn-helix transcriptional regulator [Pseudomonas aeruginosa]MBI8003636.1 helix-turn-helix transcriptional regulator [Pseudomonas aeruginosa]MBI8226157.1 helix-turn-helix transcriptional regulator [Pseudomonas aeruginosa]MCO2939574.1 helix-turn-helix transcriptional regulator [Pseudomonas aeruginosa]
MTKAIYRPEYAVFLKLLKRHRIAAGLTQEACSKALDRPQSFMSDVERGSRRLDIIQLRDLCLVLSLDLSTLILEFEQALAGLPCDNKS